MRREVRVLQKLPAHFEALHLCAKEEGYTFLTRLQTNWKNGSNRFAQPGESLQAVLDESGQLCAIGGLNIDPYLSDARVGRIRHFYVLPEFRRSGAGSLLLNALLRAAVGNFDHLRLRTYNPEAAAFYEYHGFKPEVSETATHCLNSLG